MPTVLVAVLAALAQMPLTDTHESACVIIAAADGALRATLPSRQSEAHFRLHIMLKPGEHIAAIVHTHPDSHVAWDRSDEPSQEDIATADALHVPSYIYVQKSKNVLAYDPTTHHTETVVHDYAD